MSVIIFKYVKKSLINLNRNFDKFSVFLIILMKLITLSSIEI